MTRAKAAQYFALPTYAFVGGVLVMVVIGLMIVVIGIKLRDGRALILRSARAHRSENVHSPRALRALSTR